ncbi:MAG: hypothetical protein FWH21_07525, partial [Kiritimatiellaeota bacterium]|nr:hypothetical protein [Kiritimatiellota bacterium]
GEDGGGHTVLFGEHPPPPPYETNRLWSLSIELGREEVVLSVSNDPSGTFTVYTNASLELWTPLPGGGSTNVFVTPFLAQEDIQTPPLPREGDRGEDLTYLWDMMDELFVLLEEPQDRASLYALLMLRAGDDGWEDILNNVFLPFFNNNLSSVNRTLRSHQMPARFGGKVGENYIALEDSASGFDPDTVDAADCRASTETYGIYYTVYPRNFVCFPEIESVPILDATGQETGEENVVTNYFRLGSKAEYHLWVNPAVALEGEYLHAGDDKVGHVYLDNGEERGCIVDEALLTNRPDQEYPPIEWSNVGVSYIPDPRRNAWAERWLFEYGGGSVGQTPGEEGGLIPPREFMHYDVPERVAADLEAYSWATKELPFIQWGAPLHSIGDLGDTYIPYRPDYHMVIDDATGTATRMSDLRYDTVTFSTRSGGALLDMFTLAPTNGPRTRYGLVQPNTELDPVIKTLFSDVTIGWTNTLDTTTQLPLKEAADMDALTELYAGSVITAPFGMGWRTFADMMPSLLATNRVLNDDFTAERTALDETRRALEDELRQGRHQMHDYLEDAMRGLIDKVSFRQNIYMVVVAAQTLSRSSTLARPVVLADQRALVTVIRDAWSGRWVIHDWKWLTE